MLSFSDSELQEFIDKANLMKGSINKNEIDLIDKTTLNTLNDSILSRSVNHSTVLTANYQDKLEQNASELWNNASIPFHNSNSHEIQAVLLNVMLFATLLINIRDSFLQKILRVLHLCIRLCNFALDEHELGIAQKSLNLAKTHMPQSADQRWDKREFILLGLANERFLLEKKEFGKAAIVASNIPLKESFEKGIIDTSEVLNFCRNLFNSALTQFEKNDGVTCLAFAEKSFEYLELIDSDNIMKKSTEESVLSLLAKVCISTKEYNKAGNYLKIYREVSPNKGEPYVLQFDLLKLIKADHKELESVILRMIYSVRVEEEIKLVNHVIKCYSEVDPEGALKCIDYTIFNKLHNPEILETLLVNRIWILTAKIPDPPLNKVMDFFNNIEKSFSLPLSKKGSNAIVTLLWNHSTSLRKKKDPSHAAKWLHLCLHRLLKNDTVLRGRIQRNILRCYLELEQYDKVDSLIEVLDEVIKDDPATIYYAFKSKLAKEDWAACKHFIDRVKNSNIASRYDTLCMFTIEASKKNNYKLTLYAMGVIMEILKIAFKESKENHFMKSGNRLLLVLALRSTIALMFLDETLEEADVEKLVKIFQGSLDFVTFLSGDSETTLKPIEIEWFAAYAYNLSGRLHREQRYSNVKSLTEVSLLLLTLVNPQTRTDIDRLKLCRFRVGDLYYYALILCALVSSNQQEKQMWMLEASRELPVWRDEMMLYINDANTNEKSKETCTGIFCKTLQLNLRLELLIGDSISVRNVLDSYKGVPSDYDIDFVQLLILLTVSEGVDPMIKSSVMLKLYEEYKDSTSIDSKTMAQLTRNLLENQIVDDESLWDRAIVHITSKIQLTFVSDRFPIEEIQWLCTKVWNRGATALVTGDLDSTTKWCNYCIQLSRYVNSDSERRYRSLYASMMEEIQSNRLNG